jgi:hypothetical protein
MVRKGRAYGLTRLGQRTEWRIMDDDSLIPRSWPTLPDLAYAIQFATYHELRAADVWEQDPPRYRHCLLLFHRMRMTLTTPYLVTNAQGYASRNHLEKHKTVEPGVCLLDYIEQLKKHITK